MKNEISMIPIRSSEKNQQFRSCIEQVARSGNDILKADCAIITCIIHQLWTEILWTNLLWDDNF